MVERSADWIRQAKRDLDNAEYELKGGYFEWVCFISQQAAEKAIKAVFQKLHREAFGHSVAGLLENLPENLKPSAELLDAAKELDKAYVLARYPNVHPKGAPFEAYTEQEAKRLLNYARRIVGFCEGLLAEI